MVCEYNPFHNGHAYQIKQIRETLGKPVVCAMSGSFVQRGEPACMPKTARAESAVKHSASVVLEIPFPYSCLTAEKFAEAGVRLLDACGMCSHIAFGSECADVGLLSELAAALSEKEIIKSIQVYQKEHPALSYARARSAVLTAHFGTKAAVCENPNDILGIEYIKAIRRLSSELIPVALARSVDRKAAPNGVFASSSLVRTLAGNGEFDRAAEFLPDHSAMEFLENYRPQNFRKAVFLLLLSKSKEQLAICEEYSGGLENAVYHAVQTAGNYEKTVEALRCKTLTDAKIRRLLLFGALGVTKEQASAPLLYTGILDSSSNPEALELLRLARHDRKIPLARRVGSVRKDKNAARQYDYNALAERILAASEQ